MRCVMAANLPGRAGGGFFTPDILRRPAHRAARRPGPSPMPRCELVEPARFVSQSPVVGVPVRIVPPGTNQAALGGWSTPQRRQLCTPGNPAPGGFGSDETCWYGPSTHKTRSRSVPTRPGGPRSQLRHRESLKRPRGKRLLRGTFDDDDAVAVNDDGDLVVDGQRDAVLGELTRLLPR